jgi:hypothetical protein
MTIPTPCLRHHTLVALRQHTWVIRLPRGNCHSCPKAAAKGMIFGELMLRMAARTPKSDTNNMSLAGKGGYCQLRQSWKGGTFSAVVRGSGVECLPTT